MGALHQGHIALIEALHGHCDVVVCSIFVNPTQFNNKVDLEQYPRTLEADLDMLENAHCDVVFTPGTEEMYPEQEEVWHLDLGELDDILEGAHRPGHFQGVTQIVKKLFDIVQPDIACFGQKDYQQVMVVQRMIDIYQIPVKLLLVPTIRESSGLAMSSRNRRLSRQGKATASHIYKILSYVAERFERHGALKAVEEGLQRLSEIPEFETEYLEIRKQGTLESLEHWNPGLPYVILTAVWIEGVRLIDNLLLPSGN